MDREIDRLATSRSLTVDKILWSSDKTSTKLTQTTLKEGFATIESGRYVLDDESIVCLSTQIGCLMSCRFCKSTEPFEYYTGRPQRFLRNLSAQEIVDQAHNIFEVIPVPQESLGIVFSYMGAGEPFANIRSVKESIIQLGVKFSQSRATLSTIAFDIAGIIKLADEVASGIYPIPIKLHISLHSPFDKQRQEIIPYASPISEMLDAAEYYARTTNTVVKLNYVLVSGLNNTTVDANRLRNLLVGRQGLIVKISDLNSDDENLVVPPDKASQFEVQLKEFGIETCRFTSRGKDINAGCGELVKGKREI